MKPMWWLIVVLFAAGCEKPAPVAVTEREEEHHALQMTRWTDKTELFAEYSPLAAGETSRFSIHLTRLDTFKPVGGARVEVRLTGASGQAATFAADKPATPGIYGVDVKPAATGRHEVSIHVAAAGLEDVHRVGAMEVHANRAAAEGAPHDHEEEGISFTKEQQWTLDFATALVETRALRATLRTPAEVTARSGGEAEVTAPFDGRLVGANLPVIGQRVQAGQTLAQLVPPTSTPADLASLELSRNEAALALELARKDRERAERLVGAGAAPAKRLDEARTLEATQQARLRAAEARLEQYEASSSAEGGAKASRLFALRAPITGTVTAAAAAPNANVKAGEALFRIVDADSVYVAAMVPEAELPRMRELSGAQLETPGREGLLPLTRLVSVGRVVDAQSRTFPVIYQLDNGDRKVAVNQMVHVHLMTGKAEAAPVVPEAALVEEAGRQVVFVQHAGEVFERRPVRLGVREGGWVQVLEGVAAGERVVSRGALLIRLASLSTEAPAHGHVH